ncbi:hypothetical protein LFYK43_17160 [Ligilactobacillus salitolerans]|uniref:Oxaloacetate decarboxylase, gamma chain n=1 Tax=Ligilactobacillus salitolerans TaxID=1808352 RepID=A0A401IUU1_9LACO|nr:OadG-related small transporter subunit [Ligilactobacillus salitolerans]GBG95257.1 hypothetical protein LFYK43_17160 [Ligilactobacillus salitolerans]
MGALLGKAFELMLFGMGGIFAVLFMIYLLILILNKAFPGNK